MSEPELLEAFPGVLELELLDAGGVLEHLGEASVGELVAAVGLETGGVFGTGGVLELELLDAGGVLEHLGEASVGELADGAGSKTGTCRSRMCVIVLPLLHGCFWLGFNINRRFF
jgi:hypothetical protein